MPDPISSSNRSVAPSSDPALDETGLVCREPAGGPLAPPLATETPPHPASVGKLVVAASPSPAALPPTASPPSQAENNAGRTMERTHGSGYFAYGVTGGARDSVFAGVAALKSHDPKSGIDVEVFSTSGQIGGENELQVAAARIGVSGKNGSLGVDVFSARASGGAHNDDGSTGFNAGAGATLVGAEGTLTDGANSLTVGLAISAGASLSVGLRDADSDGSTEFCFRGSLGPVTVGFCAED
jgi:hypothetical protein